MLGAVGAGSDDGRSAESVVSSATVTAATTSTSASSPASAVSSRGRTQVLSSVVGRCRAYGRGRLARVHPLAQLLSAAADGVFPPADGSWRRMPPWRPGVGAVVALTGTAVVVDDGPVPDGRLSELGVDGFGGAHHPRVIDALAGATGWVDSLDLVLAARGRGDDVTRPALVPRPDLAEHPRVRFARGLRNGRRGLRRGRPRLADRGHGVDRAGAGCPR